MKQPTSQWKNTQEIVELSPRDMADYLTALENGDELETYLTDALKDQAISAKISYWEKWFTKKQRKLVERIIKQTKEADSTKEHDLPLGLEEKFSEPQLKAIFSNIGAIQLTFGCSKGCPLCGFDAVRGVKEHIPYEQLQNLFQHYGTEIGEAKPFLYYASEPSDYKFGDKTYKDVHELAESYAGYSPYISSKETDDEVWLDYLNSGKGDKRISAYGADEQLVGKIRSKYEKIEIVGEGQKHYVGLGVSSRRKGRSSSSIGCFDGLLLTPRGLYNVFRTRTSVQEPQGFILVPFAGFTEEPVQPGESIQSVLTRFILPYFNRRTSDSFSDFPLNLMTVMNAENRMRHFLIDGEKRVVCEYQPGHAEEIRRFEEAVKESVKEFVQTRKLVADYKEDENIVAESKRLGKMVASELLETLRQSGVKTEMSLNEIIEKEGKLKTRVPSFSFIKEDGEVLLVYNREKLTTRKFYPGTKSQFFHDCSWAKKLTTEDLKKLHIDSIDDFNPNPFRPADRISIATVKSLFGDDTHFELTMDNTRVNYIEWAYDYANSI